MRNSHTFLNHSLILTQKQEHFFSIAIIKSNHLGPSIMSLSYTDLEILEKNVAISLDAIKKTGKGPIIQEAKEVLKKEIETLLDRARVRQDFKVVKNTYAVTSEDNAQASKIKKNIEAVIKSTTNVAVSDPVIKCIPIPRNHTNIVVNRVELKGIPCANSAEIGDIYAGAALFKGIGQWNKNNKNKKQRLFISQYTPRCARKRANKLQEMAKKIRTETTKTNSDGKKTSYMTRLKINHTDTTIQLMVKAPGPREQWQDLADSDLDDFKDDYTNALQIPYEPYVPKAKQENTPTTA